jgi:hypothetical protein
MPIPWRPIRKDVYKFNQFCYHDRKFYDDFDACRESIQKKADEKYADTSKEHDDSRIIQDERRTALRAHVALDWEMEWRYNNRDYNLFDLLAKYMLGSDN